mgnify:CR=1 FL=1
MHGLACAYYPNLAGPMASMPYDGGELRWDVHHLSPYQMWRWPRYLARLRELALGFAPDAIFASSDAWQLGAAAWLSRSLKVPLIADFYDNYESFGASSIPGARRMLRWAARNARMTTFVSDPLRRMLIQRYGLSHPAHTLENAVEPHFFSHNSVATARMRLGLPIEARLIGTAGALDGSRGEQALYDAFVRLAEINSDLYLVLAGDPRPAPPPHPRIIKLGTLGHEQMPLFWKALNVAVICLKDDAFGRFCFPQKLAEVAAVGTPVVFPRIGIFAEPGAATLGECAETPDADGYAAAIQQQLAVPRASAWRPDDWPSLAAKLEGFLNRALLEGAGLMRNEI